MNIIDDLGGPAAVARMVGCKPPSVVEWRKRNSIPVERCPDIERGSEGRFPCEKVRPDVAWARVADTAWPWHPLGRPTWDMTVTVPTAQPEMRNAA